MSQIRVERERHNYRVRSVKRGSPLKPWSLSGGIEVILLAPFAFAYLAWQDRQQTYKVGILREPKTVGVFFNLRTKVIHKELVTSEVDPRARVHELAEEVRKGNFDS